MGDGKAQSQRKAPSRSEPGNSSKRSLGSPLDERWLEKYIQEMYREVVEEPIPEELLKILNRVPKLDR